MKNLTRLLLLAACAISAWAHAEIPAMNGTPRLEFQTIPYEGAPPKERKILPYRFYDTMIISVWDSVTCGQKATNAAFSIQGNKLLLNYSLSKAPDHTRRCTLLSEFKIDNVPNKDLEINFAGGQEPYVVASMKKCEFYKPTTDDVWECLVPTIGD